MWTLRKILAGCLDPIVLIFVILLVAFILLLCHLHRTGLVLMAVGLLGLLVLSLPFVPNHLLSALERRYSPVATPKPDVRWVLVLGAGMVYDKRLPADMQLNAASTLRLVDGVRLYKQLPHAKLVLSGGKTIDEKLETTFRRDVARMLSVPDSALVTMPSALNTQQEARFAKKIIGDAPFYLVTSATHMARSMALFKAQGMQPIAAPANFIVRQGRRPLFRQIVPSSSNFVKMTIYFYEKVGVFWAWLRGYLY